MNDPTTTSRFLFPTDFSDNASRALPYAVERALHTGASLHLLHVLEAAPIIGEIGWVDTATPNVIEVRRDRAREHLAEMSRELGVPRERLELVVRHGAAFEEIVDYAADHRVDLIVMSTHGHSGLKHFLMGSCAERVVRLANCPVLTISGHVEVDSPERAPEVEAAAD